MDVRGMYAMYILSCSLAMLCYGGLCVLPPCATYSVHISRPIRMKEYANGVPMNRQRGVSFWFSRIRSRHNMTCPYSCACFCMLVLPALVCVPVMRFCNASSRWRFPSCGESCFSNGPGQLGR
ncbi:hypothetical protein GGR54DRAFT_342608 [Hypoxylon sp. NC1633]|nr:hypothetical protein GGR54DRAFT_342608 [Hypoxylon sp. NC1633]